ncbi:hypothetical protein F2Q69_00006519 [Brassica cretica]|uniref:Uncharacterized protein n=1 Tax=Brassica cretica TaxID=69181 RepID=A0A8S9NRA2_BRACR|nr:hypothetical protein F2Q69_00006519 [Brassica cretica]
MRSDTRASARLVSDWLLIPINSPRPPLTLTHPEHFKLANAKCLDDIAKLWIVSVPSDLVPGGFKETPYSLDREDSDRRGRGLWLSHYTTVQCGSDPKDCGLSRGNPKVGIGRQKGLNSSMFGNMEGSLYQNISIFWRKRKGMVPETGPGVLSSGDPGRLLAGTRRPVSCLGSRGIQYLSIFPTRTPKPRPEVGTREAGGRNPKPEQDPGSWSNLFMKYFSPTDITLGNRYLLLIEAGYVASQGLSPMLEDFIKAIRGFLQVLATSKLLHKLIAKSLERGYGPGRQIDGNLVSERSIGVGVGIAFPDWGSYPCDVPQSEDQSMESDQNEDQNVRNSTTEVQSIDRAEHTTRAVYRLDPPSSGLELQHNPRPDGQINHTEVRLSRHVRHAKSIGQARSEVVRVESKSDHGLSLLSRLGRTGDRSDELIRHFDQFMNFDQPNLSKARLLRLSEDLATFWPGTVHESHPSVHEERTGRVLLLTAGRAISYTEPGQE